MTFGVGAPTTFGAVALGVFAGERSLFSVTMAGQSDGTMQPALGGVRALRGGAEMKYEFNLVDLLWSALRGLESSTDQRKNAPPLVKLRQQMLLTIAMLNDAEPGDTRPRQSARKRLAPTRTLARKPKNAA